MSARYATLSPAEARELIAKRGAVRNGPHKLTARVLHWAYCTQCGLLALRNDATRAALRRPCVWEDD